MESGTRGSLVDRLSAADDELPPESPTDHLAKGAQGGDQARFCALYERVAPAIYGWARIRLPAGLRAVVGPEDIVQEVWLRAIGSLQEFDSERGPFRRWVFGIARNVWLRAMRSSRANAARGYRDGGYDLGAVPDSATAVSRRASRKEGVHELIAACGSLSPEDRELLLLRGLEGRTHDEVALELGVGVDAVRKRWQRLRKQLEGVTGLDELVEG